METYSDTVGLPVICSGNTKKVGNISDVIFNPETKEIIGFGVEMKGLLRLKKMVEIKDVLSLGKDAMVIVNQQSLVNDKKHALKYKLIGNRIYTKTGNELGVVKDVLFDFNTGKIEGLEASDGLLQDIISGRNIIPLFGKVELGEETILIDREALEEIISTGGGLKNKL